MRFALLLASMTFLPGAIAQKTNVGWYEEERPIDVRLFAAIRDGKVETVRALLAKGANPNANQANGWSPLTSLGGTPEQMLAIAKLLVAEGAKVNARQDGQGFTPLTYALNNGGDAVGLVRYFILKGANVNAPMEDGTTALHLAVNGGYFESARELLAHGAKVDARTNDQEIVKSNDPALDESMRRQMVKDEEQNGHVFEPGFRSSGLTPIHGVAMNWSPAMANLLLKAGASLKAVDDNGWTPLHYAAKHGNVPAIGGLIALGADPNAASKGGYRPLHLALRAGYGVPEATTIRALLEKGADPQARNREGKTPFDLLRADAEWLIGNPSNDPERAFPAQALPSYLQMVNAAAKLLDPKSPPIVVALPKPDPKGTRYAPLEFGDGTAERIVRVENGQAVLELRLPGLASGAATLKIDEVSLEEYDTVTPLPLVVKRTKGVPNTLVFRFPEGAAKGGHVVMDYTQEGPGDQSIGSGGGDSSHPSPGFRMTDTVSVDHSLPGRTMEFEIVSVRRAGKALPAYAGKRFLVPGGKPVVIPGLKVTFSDNLDAPKTEISYRYRFVPNTKWRSGFMSLG